MHDRRTEPATQDDLASVLALVRAAGLPTEGIADQFPGGYVVVRSGPTVIAVAGLEAHGAHGLLRSVAVAPAHRGGGLGKLLVEERLRRADEQGLASVYLLTTTAAEYFERLGFAVTSRASAPASLQTCSEFSAVCPASAACLAKSFA